MSLRTARLRSSQPVMVVESMKMEIQIPAGANGTVTKILKHEGSAVTAGQPLMVIKEDE